MFSPELLCSLIFLFLPLLSQSRESFPASQGYSTALQYLTLGALAEMNLSLRCGDLWQNPSPNQTDLGFFTIVILICHDQLFTVLEKSAVTIDFYP